MQNIVVVGASGHAAVLIDILEKQAQYRVVGLIDSLVSPGTEFLGYRVLGSERDLGLLAERNGIEGGIVAIGDNWVRSGVVRRLLEHSPDFRFVSAIHPSAQIARGVSIGAGTAVMAGVVVNTRARVEQHCILNTKCSLDHDSVMEEFSSLGPGATTGGNVRIGAFSVLAQGANVIHGVQIGTHAVIGAGSTVLRDTGDYCVAYGTPARFVRERKAGDKYL